MNSMIVLLRKLMGRHAKAVITVHSTVDRLGLLILTRTIQSMRLSGFVDTLQSRRDTVLELEGPRADLEQLVAILKHPNDMFMTRDVGVRWFPYKGQFDDLKVLV